MVTMPKIQPPGRREINRQERRETIIKVAAQSFLEHGYAGTSMSSIAVILGGSKGTLWSYFASKEDLFTAVIDHATTAFRADMSVLLDPCSDLDLTLKRFGMSFVEKVSAPPAIGLNRLIIAESGRFPELGQIFYDRGPRLTRALLAEFLSGAMDRGLLRRADPVEAARLLMALYMTNIQQQVSMGVIDHATSDMIEADVDLALQVFKRAYAAKQDN